MAIPQISPKDVQLFLDVAEATQIPLMLRGGPGLGKSSLFKQFAARRNGGYGYVDSRPALWDYTDAKGFPAVTADGRMNWIPVNEFPLEGNDRLPDQGIWVFEELPSAMPAVQASLYQGMLDRVFCERPVKAKWFIVTTGNRLGDKGVVNRMPSPLVSRMTHAELVISADEWSEWALNPAECEAPAPPPAPVTLDRAIVPELVAFFRLRPEFLNEFDPQKWVADTPYCCPRTVEFLSKILQVCAAWGVKPTLPLISSAVGEGVGTEIYAYLDIYASAPNVDAILLDPDGAPVPEKPSHLYAVSSALARRASVANADRVFRYLKRLPKEFEVCTVRDMLRLTKAIVATRALTDWSVRNAGVLS